MSGRESRLIGRLRAGFITPDRYAKRETFYIDPHGIIRHVDRSVSAAGHGADIARQLGALGFTRRNEK